MIKSPKIRRRLCRELKQSHWIGKRHRIIFKIIKKLNDADLSFDYDTFESFAKEEDDYGGISYLQKIDELFQENANIDYHIEILKSDAVKNNIKERKIKKFQDILEDPHSSMTEIDSVLNEMKEEVKENFTTSSILKGVELRKSYWQDIQQRKKKSIFIPTGIKGLDRWLGEGLAKKKCSIWAARPAMGKTTTMANVILNLIRGIKNSKGEIICEPKKVFLAPLETGPISMIDTMVAALIKEKLESEMDENSALPKNLIGMKLDRFTKFSDQMTKEEDDLIKWAMDIIFQNENLTIANDPTLSLTEASILLENGDYDVAIFDLWERLSDIEIDAGKITKKLYETQRLAKKANCHICIVQQIKRGDSKGKPKKPTMELLKNSGGYEEIADLIVFMHRAKYYNPDLEEDVIEYIIGKQRRGSMNKTVYHDFWGDYGTIGEHRKNYTESSEEGVFGK